MHYGDRLSATEFINYNMPTSVIMNLFSVVVSVGHLSLITVNHKTRQHNLLNVKDLRPSKHYFPSDIMNLR
jgi:hypothetical protein